MKFCWFVSIEIKLYMAIHPCVKWRDMARHTTLPILIPQPKVLLFFSTHLALDSSSQSLFNYSGVSSNMVQVRNKMGRCMIHWMVIVVLYYYVFLLQALISSCELWYDIQRPDKCLIWRYAAMCTVCCIAFASMRFPICQVLNVPIYPSAEGATHHADCMIDHATEGSRPKNSTFHLELSSPRSS